MSITITKLLSKQIGCVQFWCHPVGINDRINSMEQPKFFTGISLKHTHSRYLVFEAPL